jgi:hypothetical protein
MSNLEQRYRWAMTILFAASLFFLSVHVIDDALTSGEPATSGVRISEFLLYAGLIYWLIPPLGLILARRNQMVGFIIVSLYALQAIYGAGLNHVRHMFGDFNGSQSLPTLLALFGIHIGDIRGYGFGSVLMGMAGLGPTPPHTHTLLSSLIAFVDTTLNAVLILVTFLALRETLGLSQVRRKSLRRQEPEGV